MKTHIVLFLTTSFCLSLIACSTGEPLTKRKSDNNTTYQIDYLFEHEGCKVYRFYDRGNYVYFTNCTGDVTAISNDSIRTRVETSVKSKLPK